MIPLKVSHQLIYMVISLLFSACGPSQIFGPTPTPSPPLFAGSLILEAGGNIYELAMDPIAKTLDGSKIAGPNTHPVVVISGKALLIYSSQGETRLRDLRSGETKVLFHNSAGCISVNEYNDDLFSYTSSSELYVFNLSTGKSTLVFTSPSAIYSPAGLAEVGAGGQKHAATVTCGAWIGSDRFVFNRYVGTMPSSITMPHTPELNPNKTTLAILGEPIKLEDAPGRLWIQDISSDGEQLLISKNNALYLTSRFNDFNSMDSRPISINVPRIDKVNFTSDGDSLYYVDQPLSGNGNIHFIDLQTLEDRVGPDLPDDWANWIWIGDPKDNVFAVVAANILIIDLDTDGNIALSNEQIFDELANSYSVPQIIAWIPN